MFKTDRQELGTASRAVIDRLVEANEVVSGGSSAPSDGRSTPPLSCNGDKHLVDADACWGSVSNRLPPAAVTKLSEIANVAIDEMDFVGVLENLDDSFTVLCRLGLCIRGAETHTKAGYGINASPREYYQRPSDEQRAVLVQALAPDIAMYEHARQRIAKDLAATKDLAAK
jgi:hypothetical protein